MFHNLSLEELIQTDFLRPPRKTAPTVLYSMSWEVHTSKELVKHVDFMNKYWSLSILIAVAYIFIIFYVQELMEGRKPFKLKRSLIAWNSALAIFSIMGALKGVPFVISDTFNLGLSSVICYTSFMCDGCESAPIWVYLFAYSKVVELADTLFVVLRKKPLIFLHWYHHATVLIYTWYAVGMITPGGTYFISMNFTVHAMMYTYYAIRAAELHVPRRIQMALTLCQIVQMFLGIFINVKSIQYKRRFGESCMVHYSGIVASIGMYASYCVLFSLFFYKAYVKKERQTEVLSPAFLLKRIASLFKKAVPNDWKFPGIASELSRKTE
ncbi:unnamed protein product [Cyprideis torosa]|uniref:Elongation of very long chain fatty acids protein n=1 Tax=Cyprideis torosa TaxID=163714 RepID=A0A7R8W9B0_9CRUS|nr:unnamed protein product [Cyprideis torosa]CAG0885144.1 unnamed protein product [Cyprideis torosa]